MIEVYGHGGDRETAAATFGGAAADFVDFSANINPLGPPPEVLEVLQSALDTVVRYPDPGHRNFKNMLARRLHVPPESLSIGNGAAESMALLLLGLAPKRVGTVEPCFSEYAELAGKFGAEVSRVYGKASLQWKADVEDILQLMEQVDVLFLGTSRIIRTVYNTAIRSCASWQRRRGKRTPCWWWMKRLLILSRRSGKFHYCLCWIGIPM